MKTTTKTAAKAAKMPTLEALEAAKAKAVKQLRKEAEEPKAKAEAKAARAKADKATAKAAALAAEWRKVRAEADKATAEALEAAEAGSTEEAEALEALTDEARALYTATKKARAKAREAEEAAEALEAKAEALAADLDHVLHGRTLCLVWTFRTPEEAEALEAKAEAREALRDLAAATAEAKAEAKSNPERAKAARARAAALAKLPAVVAAKAAEAKAAEARKNAPKVSAYIGAAVNESRPTLSLAFAHSVAARIAEALKITDKVTKTAAVWNVADPATIFPAARAVAKKTAENATMRQGTPTQWRIYREALAGEWEAPDLADMVTEAAAALAIFTAPADMVRRETEAAALLEKTAEALEDIGTFDGVARAAVVQAAEAESRAYMPRTASDPRLCDNPHKMRIRAAALRVALEARTAAKAGNEAEALDLATRAAFRAVNNYLAEARAIRAEAKAEALNLEALAETIADPRHLDPEAVTEYEAKHRAIIRAAYAEAVEAMTPAQKKALCALYKAGGSVCEAARIADRNESTIREHRRALADIFAAALVKTAPESIEQKALNLVSVVGGLEAAEAAAAIAAAKAGKAAKAAAETAKAKTKAARAKAAEALEKAKVNEATAAAIAAAVAEAVEELPPVMKQTAHLLASGNGKREAARIMGKNEKTVREAATRAAEKIAAAIAAAAPAVDIPADIIARADLAALFALAESVAA